MKSHKEHDLSIALNNQVTSRDPLDIINMDKHIRLNDLVDALFSQIGLKRNEKYKLIELIRLANNNNIKIVSVVNHMFPENFNPDINEIATTDFKKRFFGSVLYDDKEDRDSFVEIMKIIDDEYVLTTLDVTTRTFFTEPPTIVLFIRGNRVNEDNTVGNGNDIIITLLFGN